MKIGDWFAVQIKATENEEKAREREGEREGGGRGRERGERENYSRFAYKERCFLGVAKI